MTWCPMERRGTIKSILGTNHSFLQGTDGHDKATDRERTKCDKCTGFMENQDEALVCVSCGRHEYFDNLPRAKRELAGAFRPSIKRIKYRGETPRFQNKMLDVQIVDSKYDTGHIQVRNRTLSFRYKFFCRYQRCGGDMKQGARNTYRKKEEWKVISFRCTKNIRHENKLYENELGEVVNWE